MICFSSLLVIILLNDFRRSALYNFKSPVHKRELNEIENATKVASLISICFVNFSAVKKSVFEISLIERTVMVLSRMNKLFSNCFISFFAFVQILIL
jgi:hypothetical protein